MALSDALKGGDATASIAKQQAVGRDAERERVRRKMGPDMREFVDQLREFFPRARLVGIKFKDGEQIGELL